MYSRLSFTAFGLPGRLMIRVFFRIPAVARLSMARFVIVIGVVPRMIGKCNRAANTLCFEQAIILGGILGNIVSVFLQMHIPLGQVSGHIFLGLYGLSAGMFVGCIAVALAEILNTFPILFRRAKLKVGLQWVMWTMAVGKTCGALYYFVKKIGEGLS